MQILCKQSAKNQGLPQETQLRTGDKVLFQRPKSQKLSPLFEATPYEVVEKRGGHVEIKSPAGVHYKGNVTDLKKYEEDKSLEKETHKPIRQRLLCL